MSNKNTLLAIIASLPQQCTLQVCGYWKDDKEEFENYIIEIGKPKLLDHQVFFNCDTPEELNGMLDINSSEDFVLTSIEIYN